MNTVFRFLRSAGLVLAVCLATAAPLHAATGKGEFALKGIGATDCATLVREFKAGTPNAMMYGGWVYGYLTAMNQSSPDTFDLAPWQDLNTLTNFLIEYCGKNPRTSVGQAVFNMTAALKPMRAKSASAPVRLGPKGGSVVVYADVITRIGQALKAKGFYKGPLDSNKPQFSDEMSQALKAFQARNKLAQTGLPDQFTLFRLFAN
ncbi:MAG: peptidoglycan-binding domain-containing protein [Pseudomonadota bacterium]|nr:peptidoglycan-binding domain-containing protein [Pseudomonadota bacterium]